MAPICQAQSILSDLPLIPHRQLVTAINLRFGALPLLQMAENLVHLGLETSVVEMLPQVGRLQQTAAAV